MNKFSISKKLFIIVPVLSLLAGYNHASENSLIARGGFGGGGFEGRGGGGEGWRGRGDEPYNGYGAASRWGYNRGYEQGEDADEDIDEEEGYPYYQVAPSDPYYQDSDQTQQDPFFFQ